MKTPSLLDSRKIVSLPVGAIKPNPHQPRRQFEPEELRELGESIRLYGILQPLTVRKTGPTTFELVAGERRLRAAVLAGMENVPCILLNVDAEQSGLLALVENLQRKDLDFIEEAEGLRSLIRSYGMSQEEAARCISKSQSAVANKLRILKLAPRPGPAAAGGAGGPEESPGGHHRRGSDRGENGGLHRRPSAPGRGGEEEKKDPRRRAEGCAHLPQHGDERPEHDEPAGGPGGLRAGRHGQ